ncbi:hypothetical protein [Amycolatopsis circi]|uniref:hypothetical protein n=1 Tax=Amycolatopsis circi TaxID=871959 RepID=UPI001FC9CEE0|nr:hypothetical protein [Amycolatopsis circi]
MVHTQFDPAVREALAAKAVEAKTRKDLTWQQIADASGLSVVVTTAAVLGQHPLPKESAEAVPELLSPDEEAALVLQTVPVRVPTDPEGP